MGDEVDNTNTDGEDGADADEGDDTNTDDTNTDGADEVDNTNTDGEDGVDASGGRRRLGEGYSCKCLAALNSWQDLCEDTECASGSVTTSVVGVFVVSALAIVQSLL